MFQPSDHLCSPQDPLQKIYIFPQLEAPDLDSVLQIGPQEHNNFSCPLRQLINIPVITNMAANGTVKKYLAGYRQHFEKIKTFSPQTNQSINQPNKPRNKQTKNPNFIEIDFKVKRKCDIVAIVLCILDQN